MPIEAMRRSLSIRARTLSSKLEPYGPRDMVDSLTEDYWHPLPRRLLATGDADANYFGAHLHSWNAARRLKLSGTTVSSHQYLSSKEHRSCRIIPILHAAGANIPKPFFTQRGGAAGARRRVSSTHIVKPTRKAVLYRQDCRTTGCRFPSFTSSFQTRRNNRMRGADRSLAAFQTSSTLRRSVDLRSPTSRNYYSQLHEADGHLDTVLPGRVHRVIASRSSTTRQ